MVELRFEQSSPAKVYPAGSTGQGALVFWAWCLLALLDVVLKIAGFNQFYRMIRVWPTIGKTPLAARHDRGREGCNAVERARTYYFKRAFCLQAAAAAVCLLRCRGIPAELVIGVRKLPFYAHAWAELDGQVMINARPELETLYRVIARS